MPLKFTNRQGYETHPQTGGVVPAAEAKAARAAMKEKARTAGADREEMNSAEALTKLTEFANDCVNTLSSQEASPKIVEKAKQLGLTADDARKAADEAYKTSGRAEAVTEDVAESRLATVRADKIEMRAVAWLWPNRIPRGKLTLLVGDPDAGKSTLAIDIAARLTTGRDWPDGKEGGEPGKVIFLSTEDDAGDTLIPRLTAAGANLSRIHFLKHTLHRDLNTNEERAATFTLADVEALKRRLIAMGNVLAVIFDPISAVAGKVNAGQNSEVRALLAPLIELAASRNFAVIGLQHMNKQATRAMYRAMDSIAWIAQSRAAWLVAVDPKDETAERRLLLRLKGNLARNPGGLSFEISEKEIPKLPGQKVSFLNWHNGTVKTTADEVLAPTPSAQHESKRDAAAEFVRSWMASKRGLVDAPNDEQIKAAGHTKDAVFRAREALSIGTTRSDKGKGWVWFYKLSIKSQASNLKSNT